MPRTLAATLPYIPPGLARALLIDPVLQPVEQRFPAAVLFADISGFTHLTETLAQHGAEGPEELTRLLNTSFSRLITAIESEGGEVVKFSGDAITALFLATEEPIGYATRRAIQAAAGMHMIMQEFTTLQTSAGPTALAVKIGIGAGQIVAFRVGGALNRWEYVVAGDPVRQVAEAEQIARRGETILSPETIALLADPATPTILMPRPLIPPTVPAQVTPAMHQALRGFIPGALRGWLTEGLGEWLAVLRPMSVLFIGLSGLDYSAPDALARLHAFLSTAQDVIYRYEGSINKMAVDDKGTILLAMYGAPPLAHADDATRAVQSASELLAIATAQGLTMAIGVATGPVFAGPVGSVNRREYTVMGDPVNLAARLMTAAGPGNIRCDYATMRDSRRMLAFEDLPPIRLKGKAGLVRIYRPLGPAQIQPQTAIALVGRHTELALLTTALDQVQAGRQRIMLLEGEAGMGKSRLLDELARLCAIRGLTGLTGAGHSSERQTPYRAWRDVFAMFFEIKGVEDPAERRRIVLAQMAEIAPELIERLPLLNDLLGTGFPPLTAPLEAERRHQCREALLVELLRRWAIERPLILVLEDVHWIDSRSWGLALATADALIAAGAPFLMVLAMRPIDAPARPQELATLVSLPGAEQITLSGLSPDETVTLAATRLGLQADALHADVAELVRQRAEGNPFFAEEIVMALRDQGLLEVVETGDQRTCVVHGDPQAIAANMPDTVQGVILSRIDRLNPEEQMLLRVGSVIGRSFPYQTLRDALRAYVPLGDGDLKSCLDELDGLGLTPQETPDPDLRHAFKHMITRDVAYSTMLFAQRRELHRRIAEWYEAHYDLDGDGPDTGEDPATLGLQRAEIINLLAYHYQQAGNHECERYYAALSGELAAAGFANAEALIYLDRAIELTLPEDRSEHRRLLLIREQVHDVLANRDQQSADIAALAELSDLADSRAQAELALRQANYHLVTDHFLQAIDAAEKTVALAQTAGWQEGETIARRIWGAALIPLARYDEACDQLGQGLKLARMIGLPGTEDDCLRDLGLIAYNQADFASAREYYTSALTIDRSIGDRRGEGVTLTRLGAVARALGESGAALAYYQQALAIDRATGDRDDEADCLRGIGLLAYDQGDYIGSQAAYETSLAIERSAGDYEGQAACLTGLGMVARTLGDFSTAQDLLHQALAINTMIGDRKYEAVVHADLALLNHQRGDDQTAYEHARIALDLARALNTRGVEATALTRLGHALARLGDSSGAETAYQAALEFRRTSGMHILALEPLAGLARLALARDNLQAAHAYANELATSLETSMGAWIDELPQICLSCYDILRATGDPRAAQVLEAACARLDHQASQIDDPARRQAFRESVPAHRALLAARTAENPTT